MCQHQRRKLMEDKCFAVVCTMMYNKPYCDLGILIEKQRRSNNNVGEELAKKYYLNYNDFYTFLLTTARYKYQMFTKHAKNNGVADVEIVRGNEEDVISKYINHLKENGETALLEEIEERKRQEKEKQLQEEAKRIREKNIERVFVSSACSFDGYRIVKYAGCVFGDEAMQLNRAGVFSLNDNTLKIALSMVRDKALKKMKEAAYNLGCNAVTEVDFDYITMAPESVTDGGGTLYQPYLVCATVNGNAVVLEQTQ